MKYLKLLILFSSFFLSTGFATTFIPISYGEQIKQADGVVQAIFKGKTYKKIKTGDVVTVASFQVVFSAGISNSEIINPNDFKVFVPGGVWDDIRYQVEGVPRFREGEEVVLFLKESSVGYTVNNLGLGKFTVENDGNIKYIKNEIFPNHARMRSIRVEDLNAMLAGSDLGALERLDQRRVYKKPKKKRRGRSPASVNESEEQESTSLNIYYLFIIFALIGAAFNYVNKKRH